MSKNDLDKICIDITSLPLTDNICKVIDEKIIEIKKFAKKKFRKTIPSKIRYKPETEKYLNTIIDLDMKRMKRQTLEEYFSRWDIMQGLWPPSFEG